MVVPRRAARSGSAAPAAIAMFWREFVALAGSAPRMMLYRLAGTATRRRRPAARRCCCCTACSATPASGTAFGGDLAQRAASARSTRCRTGRRSRRSSTSPTRSRRRSTRSSPRPAHAQVVDRRAQHGRARRARVPAPVRRRQGAARDHARHAAPRQRARVARSPARRSAQMRPGNAWLAELNRAEVAAAACRRSCRSGRGTTRWSRRRRSSRLDGAENIALAGVGHNALLGDRRRVRAVARRCEKRGRLGCATRDAATQPSHTRRRPEPLTSECPA